MPGLDAFENNVRRYEAWFEENPFAYVSELHAVQALLPLSENGIELGVGTGRFAFPLGIRTGVDPSRAMAELAGEKGIEVVKGVAENLPFQDASFDFVLMVTTVCFLDDIELAFQEAFRVIRPGGSFIIGFVDRDSPIGKAYILRKNDSLFYKDATFYSVNEIVPLLTNAGFKIVGFRQTLFGPVEDMKLPSPIKEGHGEGSFVVIKAEKDNNETKSDRLSRKNL